MIGFLFLALFLVESQQSLKTASVESQQVKIDFNYNHFEFVALLFLSYGQSL